MKTIIKFTTSMIIALLISSTITAQKFEDFEVKKGDIEINAGVGLVPTFVNVDTKATIPPLSLQIAYRLKKNLSLGAYLGHSTTKYIIEGDDKSPEGWVKNRFYLMGIRLEGHFQRDRMDFYGGAMLGYNFSKIATDASNPDRVDNHMIGEENLLTYSGSIGIKYKMTERMGIYGEVGYGVSLVNLGISYKL